MIRSRILASLVGGLSLIAFSTAGADIIPTFENTTPDAQGHRWHYSAVASNQQRVEPANGDVWGDFFTIYDFLGYVDGTNQQPEGWEFSAQLTGRTPNRVEPEDNGSIWNLTWTRTGPTVGDGTDVELGTFSAVSTIGTPRVGWFTGRGTNATGGVEDGSKIANVGRIAVPIPLPAAALVFPLGAAVAGLAYRRMKV